MSLQYVELRPTIGAEIVSLVWGTAANFNEFRVLAALLHGTPVLGVSQTFATLNRGRHLYSAGRPSRWASAHILVLIIFRYGDYGDNTVEENSLVFSLIQMR